MTVPTVTLNQLESHLWEAANILRGPVDAADFKTYVFPLLFFKRFSDVHDEEYQTALEESGGDEEYARFPQNYRFQVPEGCHWRDVRAVSTNVGQALQTALRGVEKANPETLYGIFGDAQWTNKDRLSDALLRDVFDERFAYRQRRTRLWDCVSNGNCLAKRACVCIRQRDCNCVAERNAWNIA